MEKVKMWLFKRSNQDSGQNVENKEATPCENIELKAEVDIKSKTLSEISEPTFPIDPKVAEFFKEFPEPYREKLIRRYSSREGLYQFDFIRDIEMRRELNYAMRGVLLEERREFEEQLKQREKDELDRRIKERKESQKNREVPKWERKFQSVIPIPVQEGETLALKLFQAANFSALGFLSILTALSSRKAQPLVSKFRFAFSLAASFNLFAVCHTIVVYRLMDWGLFDRTIDDRDVIDKSIDEIKAYFFSKQNSQNENKADT